MKGAYQAKSVTLELKNAKLLVLENLGNHLIQAFI